MFRSAQYQQEHRHSRHSLGYSLTKQQPRNGYVSYMFSSGLKGQGSDLISSSERPQQNRVNGEKNATWPLSSCGTLLFPCEALLGMCFIFCFMKRRLITSCLKLPLSAEVLPINLPCRKPKPVGSSCSEVISLYSDQLRLNAQRPSQTKLKAE